MNATDLVGKKFRIRKLNEKERVRFGDRSDGLSTNDEVVVMTISPGGDGLYAFVEKLNGRGSDHRIPAVFLDVRKCVDPADIMVQPEDQSIIDHSFVNPIKRVHTERGHAWMVSLVDDPKVQFVTKEVQIWQD